MDFCSILFTWKMKTKQKHRKLEKAWYQQSTRFQHFTCAQVHLSFTIVPQEIIVESVITGQCCESAAAEGQGIQNLHCGIIPHLFEAFNEKWGKIRLGISQVSNENKFLSFVSVFHPFKVSIYFPHIDTHDLFISSNKVTF